MGEPEWTVRTDDLRGCSFEQFLDYAFDRPVPACRDDLSWWHADPIDEVRLLVDAPRQLEHACRLFSDPLLLATRTSVDQLDQGFWFLALGHIEPDFAPFFLQPLWSEHVDLALRCRCVSAMFELYEKLFAEVQIEGAAYMWWDLLSTFQPDLRALRPHPVPTQERVRREMVATLARILHLPQPDCQKAALHGLEHIATAGEREPLIDRYLEDASLDTTLREYARACRGGELP